MHSPPWQSSHMTRDGRTQSEIQSVNPGHANKSSEFGTNTQSHINAQTGLVGVKAISSNLSSGTADHLWWESSWKYFHNWWVTKFRDSSGDARLLFACFLTNNDEEALADNLFGGEFVVNSPMTPTLNKPPSPDRSYGEVKWIQPGLNALRCDWSRRWCGLKRFGCGVVRVHWDIYAFHCTRWITVEQKNR